MLKGISLLMYDILFIFRTDSVISIVNNESLRTEPQLGFNVTESSTKHHVICGSVNTIQTLEYVT